MRSLNLQLLLVAYVARVTCIQPPGSSSKRINLVGANRAASTADAAGVSTLKQHTAGRRKPNFVFILVDDQDKAYNSSHPDYQPALHKYLRSQGTEFDNHYVTTPVCCPSRTNILFGKYSHNTNMTDVFPPHGGYTKWLSAGLYKGQYLPQYLSQAGYNTYYVGKFVVEYALYNKQPAPEGWTDFDAALHPWVFRYEYPVFSRNGGDATVYAGQYHTDVVAAKAAAQIQSAKKAGKPFYIQVAPIGCHDACYVDEDFNGYITSPLPAPRHAKLYAEVDLPHHANFNEEDVSDKPAWIRALPRLDRANVSYLNEYYRNRLRSLRAVDELIETVVREVEAAGELDNTYFIYTSDNGYHLGAHRMGAGKETPYQEDLQVPFVIAGPGIKRGVLSHEPTAHEDILPTILSLAGVDLPDDLDGQPLPLPLTEYTTVTDHYQQPENKFEQHLTEFWGLYADQLSDTPVQNFRNNTWKAVSVHTLDSRQYKYVVRCTGEREFYDRSADQFELVNSVDSADSRLLDRLDALVSALAHAKGSDLLDPWSIIHPDNSVDSLAEALDAAHDKYYRDLPKFEFLECLDYYETGNELSTFYPPSNTAGIESGAAAGAVDLAETRLLQYQEAVQQGYAKQRQFAINPAVDLPLKVPPGTVLADVERHAAPLPAAVFDRFRKYQASLVDESKYRRLRTMV